MDREQAIKILKILKTAYPKFYADMNKQEAEDTINLWIDMFRHENVNLVVLAVKNLINTFKWPPTIADVKEEMYKLTEEEKDTPIEVWNLIKSAIRNSGYYSYEEFHKLPEIAQKFVGSPNQLREWALSVDYNDGVIKGQFLKQFEILQKRDKEEKMMLPEVRDLVKQIATGTEILSLEERISLKENATNDLF
mgnify:CR=1 FL=1